MATFDCEVFGYIQYNPELSYAELIECEETLKEGLTEVLHACGADHLDVFGLDDGLRIQFVLEEYGENALHEMCDAVAPVIPSGVTARMFAVQKKLEIAHLYHFEGEIWKESAINIASPIR